MRDVFSIADQLLIRSHRLSVQSDAIKGEMRGITLETLDTVKASEKLLERTDKLLTAQS